MARGWFNRQFPRKRGQFSIHDVKDRGLVPDRGNRESGFGPSILYGRIANVKKIFKDKRLASGKPVKTVKTVRAVRPAAT